MSDILSAVSRGNAQRITAPLDMGDLDSVYAGAVFDVWLTPSRGMLKEWQALTRWVQSRERSLTKRYERAETAERKAEIDAEADALKDEYASRQIRWYAQIWQNVSEDEAGQIFEALPEVAWDWLVIRTSQMIGQYKQEKLKNSRDG